MIRNIYILLLLSLSYSTTLLVPEEYSTIQSAIDASSDGDEVLVSAGTYLENINFNGKNISVIGEDRETTIIDGNQAGSVVTFENGESEEATIISFTIQGGNSSSGGGIFCNYLYTKPTLENLIIKDNFAIHGGGISIINPSDPIIKNVIITNNIASNNGGGINIAEGKGRFNNVTISGNTAQLGGGIFGILDADPSLVNCILWNNIPQEIYLAEEEYPSSITIFYSDIQGGEEAIETNYNGTVYWGEGNIDVNPLFDDSLYHLSINSPCIDAGNPSTEYNDACLPPGLGGVRNDMGAYGGPGNCGWLDSGNTSPEVTNITFQQDTEGEQLVTITYDLDDADGDEMTVTTFVSFDGGNEWTECEGVDGDIGAGIDSGMNKQITWDFGTQFPNAFSNQVLIKVEADDGN